MGLAVAVVVPCFYSREYFRLLGLLLEVLVCLMEVNRTVVVVVMRTVVVVLRTVVVVNNSLRR